MAYLTSPVMITAYPHSCAYLKAAGFSVSPLCFQIDPRPLIHLHRPKGSRYAVCGESTGGNSKTDIEIAPYRDVNSTGRLLSGKLDLPGHIADADHSRLDYVRIDPAEMELFSQG